MDVTSKLDTVSPDIADARRELEKAFAPLTQAGIEVDIRDATKAGGFTAS